MLRAAIFASTVVCATACAIGCVIGCVIGCTREQDVALLPAPPDAAPDLGIDVHLPSKCPSGMVDVGAFCIDATEVTRGAYAKFLSATPPPTQSFQCQSWNGSLSPQRDTAIGIDCGDTQLDLATDPSLPVVCVDWCDADSYCRWAGKRLCGAIAESVDGGAAIDAPEEYFDGGENDPTKSQWYLACAGEEGRLYPYGNSYVPGACKDHAGEADGGANVAPVGVFVSCHGPIGTPNAAIFDLSGNATEWIDACQNGSDHSLSNCMLRGGWFGNDDDAGTGDASGALHLACPVVSASALRQPRNRFDDHIGFRCCWP